MQWVHTRLQAACIIQWIYIVVFMMEISIQILQQVICSHVTVILWVVVNF